LALSARLPVMPDPGKTMTPAGTMSSIRSLRLNGAALPSSFQSGCDASCYRCLQSFRNRMEHALLDRKLGIQLLEHALGGGYPEYPPERAERSLDLLASDLKRQFGTEFSFMRNIKKNDAEAGAIVVPLLATRHSTGTETWVSLSSPLAPDVPIVEQLRALSAGGKAKLECADDLVVRRHLPEASLRLRDVLR
jgi:hypothetical protein